MEQMVALHETVHHSTSQVLQKFVGCVTDIITMRILSVRLDQMVQEAGHLWARRDTRERLLLRRR